MNEFTGQTHFGTGKALKLDPYRLGNLQNMLMAYKGNDYQWKRSKEGLQKMRGPEAPVHMSHITPYLGNLNEINNSIAKLQNTPTISSDGSIALAGNLAKAEKAYETRLDTYDKVHNAIQEAFNKNYEIDYKNALANNEYKNKANQFANNQTQMATEFDTQHEAVKNQIAQNAIKGELGLLERNALDANAEAERQYKQNYTNQQYKIINDLKNENRTLFDKQIRDNWNEDTGPASDWRKKYGVDNTKAYTSKELDDIYKVWASDDANKINWKEGENRLINWISANPAPKAYNSINPYWGPIFAKDGSKLTSENSRKGERNNRYSISEKLWIQSNQDCARYVLETSKDVRKLLMQMLKS